MKEYSLILTILIGWNVLTFLLMGLDKLLAIWGKRRIPESTLLGSAFLLGAFGSAAGALLFHHKGRKAKFIILLPIAVVINAVAFVGLYTILK